MGAAVGPGDYHGTMSQAELEREAGGRIFTAGQGTETRDQVEKTKYQGSSMGSSGSSYGSSSGGSSYGASGSSYGSSGSSYGSSGSSYDSSAGSSSSGSSGSSSGSSGSSGSSSGSSGSSYSASSSGAASSSVELDANDVVETAGGKWVWSEVSQKWEWEAAGGVQEEKEETVETNGWRLLPNGTWTRSSSYSSSTVQESRNSAGGLGTGVVLPGGGEQGHQDSNSTGWVEMPDGTMVKKTSSWASWSSSSYDNLDDSKLQNVQRGLDQRVRNQLPSNVEPGYESQYQSRSRSRRSPEEREIEHQRYRRSLAEFEAELKNCGDRCTVIKCTIGPLEKDESVLFKVRSRLFTETQIKNYAEKVTISSKLVTRVTRLPFLVPEEHLASQSHSVTTVVIPSEPGEVGIPWWVWLLAALGGCLLLALITYCLYKVTASLLSSY